jgi:hypothetical protein
MTEYAAPIFRDLHRNAPGIVRERWNGAVLEVGFRGGGVFLIDLGRGGPQRINGATLSASETLGIVEEVCRELKAGWPRCPHHEWHPLMIDSTEDDWWLCPAVGERVARVGGLADSGPTRQQDVSLNCVRWWNEPGGFGIVRTIEGDAWLTSFSIETSDPSGYRNVREGQVLSQIFLETGPVGRLPNVALACP